MSFISPRSYNCKDEELSVVCGFAGISLERDLADFSAFSPKFNAAYVLAYKASIEAASELVQPKSETVELKMINEHMYATLESLILPINYVGSYIKLAGKAIPMSATDFGLTQLRKSVRSRDVENVLLVIHTVEANLNKYNKELTAVGLTAITTEKFATARTSLAIDKNKRYTLVSGRMALVQNNLGMLNELHEQLTDICEIGKVLYKQTDKAKLNDYTFSYLMKQVRRKDKPENKTPE